MISRKSRHEISLMKTAGSIVEEVLNELQSIIKPGISTQELDEIAEKIILKNNAIPSFKGYHGFPSTLCTSINEEVVHGIPNKDIILKEGDIISIDVGASYRGLIGDSAITVGVGNVSSELQKLMNETKQALFDAIKKVASGNLLNDVSGAIEDRAKLNNFGLVTQYGGHGVGRQLHEEPFVFNYRVDGTNLTLKSGMVIAIEPMFNLGTGSVHTLADNWTVVTDDGKPSAHFEHTVLVTKDGYEILTLTS